MASSLQPATDDTLTSVAPFACRKYHTEMGQPPATLEGQIWCFLCRRLPTDHPKPLCVAYSPPHLGGSGGRSLPGASFKLERQRRLGGCSTEPPLVKECGPQCKINHGPMTGDRVRPGEGQQSINDYI